MSGISGVGSNNLNLLSLLSQNDASASDPSLLNSLVQSGVQAVTQSAGNATTGDTTAAGTSDLQSQIQSAVSAALQTSEQSGSGDLKTAVYNALVGVLKANNIDPKTFKPTGNAAQSGNATSGGSQTGLDSSTKTVLSEVLSALNTAQAADPILAELSASSNNQTSGNLFSLLGNSTSASSLTQNWSTVGGNQSGLSSSPVQAAQNAQSLLGFLYDSGQ